MKPKDLPWRNYLVHGIGRRLALVGERLGWDSLVYNPLVMRHYHAASLHNAPKVASAILSVFPHARSFLDVGSGTGTFAAELLRRDKEIIACERSSEGRRLARQQGVDCRVFDLTRNPPAAIKGSFDVVTCFEVAEHLTPDLGETLVDFISAFKTTVVFSAAPPGQGGTGHINEQSKDYWIAAFERRQHFYDEPRSAALAKVFQERGAAPWFERNVCVFSF